MQLPTRKVEPELTNPTSLLIYSNPKSGKTTICAGLEDSLLIDLEKGSKFVSAVKIQIRNVDELNELARAIKEQMEQTGQRPYKYIIIDTVTALEEMVVPLAARLYKATPMGKNYDITKDVRTMAKGAGYMYLRNAMTMVLNTFEPLSECLILLGHLKTASIDKDGHEVSYKDVDLTGKIKSMVTADVDAIAFFTRDKDDKGYLRFTSSSDEVMSGSRPPHLSGKSIEISSKNEDGLIETHWDRIFLTEKQ